ncbi:hypothetical protein DERF_012189 [Dermatophagoides farinae]|uniref:Uncharacterized protein n=1 Tax=Dermatophagoides farinae TaxID=6954 RepID=A0A922HRN4_DERFA|nr:hypothetical protein DERF_012189 [Dermatophagoides farinae]
MKHIVETDNGSPANILEIELIMIHFGKGKLNAHYDRFLFTCLGS